MTSPRAVRCLALTASLLVFILGGFAGCGGGDDSSPGTDGGGASDATADATTDACSAGNLQTDPNNCGVCGKVCGSGDDCVSGACVAPCLLGQNRCSGRCVALETDNVNCGSCGTACGTGLVCSNGTCAVTCALPLTTCVLGGTVETGDGGSDSGLADAGSGDAATDAGDASTVDASEPDASSAETTARYCANAASDEANCGGCGITCGQGQQCDLGTCADTCSIGETLCSGSCRDLSTDLASCGTCGAACGAGQVCSGGVCQASCGLPFTRCGNACSNLATDPDDCGGCGTVCTPANVKAPACTSGACTFVSCQKGFSDCDGNLANGCELPTSSDAKNCGGCGLQCNGAHVVATACSGGSCGYTACQSGFADCDGIAANGCEADLSAAATCGSCTTMCVAPQACGAGGTCVGATTGYLLPDYGATATLPKPLTWTITTLQPAAIFYTLDGTTPSIASTHGQSPLVLSNVATVDGSTTVLQWFTFDTSTGTSSPVQKRTISTSSKVQTTQTFVTGGNLELGEGEGTTIQPNFLAVQPNTMFDFSVSFQASDPCSGAACSAGDAVLVGVTTPFAQCFAVPHAPWPGTSESGAQVHTEVFGASVGSVVPVHIGLGPLPVTDVDDCATADNALQASFTNNTAPIIGYLVIMETPAVLR